LALVLYQHPLSSFCQKAIMAFHEAGIEFTPKLIDLGSPESAGELKALWPIGKFPLLRDEERDLTLPESAIIIEHLAATYPAARSLVPADSDRARDTRLWDRFYDLYVNVPMQKIITDRLRPKPDSDRFGVEQARAQLATAYDVAADALREHSYAAGHAFTMADCAAAPALFYADTIVPLAKGHTALADYFMRLRERPSFQRVLEGAAPYLHLVPKE
jgi:glutathione S-transferase